MSSAVNYNVGAISMNLRPIEQAFARHLSYPLELGPTLVPSESRRGLMRLHAVNIGLLTVNKQNVAFTMEELEYYSRLADYTRLVQVGVPDMQSIFYQPADLLSGKTRIALFMNDVHYYLSGFSPSYDCTMYITGCDFYPIPGFYTLPAGEGSYVISARPDFSAHVCMMTQGSDIAYSHDFVSVPE